MMYSLEFHRASGRQLGKLIADECLRKGPRGVFAMAVSLAENGLLRENVMGIDSFPEN
jgi:hypothetical protein